MYAVITDTTLTSHACCHYRHNSDIPCVLSLRTQLWHPMYAVITDTTLTSHACCHYGQNSDIPCVLSIQIQLWHPMYAVITDTTLTSHVCCHYGHNSKMNLVVATLHIHVIILSRRDILRLMEGTTLTISMEQRSEQDRDNWAQSGQRECCVLCRLKIHCPAL